MRWTWALAALLLLPVAGACSLRTYNGEPFDPLEWTDGTHLRFDKGDHHWVVLDVANGTSTDVDPKTLPDPSFNAAPQPASASGGGYRIDPKRGPDRGMQSNCFGPAQPLPGDIYAYGLRDPSGFLLREWSTGNESMGWRGTVWGNETHGFVWDHLAEDLSIVSWSDGAVEDRAIDVGDPREFWSAYPDRPADLHEGALVLTGRSQVAVVDPGQPKARVLSSPLEVDPEGNLDGAEVRDGSVFFTHLGEGRRSIARVDLESGALAWKLTVDAYSAYTRHGVFAYDETMRALGVYQDGELLASYKLSGGDGEPILVRQGESMAIGLPGAAPRLIVYGSDMQVLYDAKVGALPSLPATTSDSWSPRGSSGPEPGPAARGSPGLPLPVVALAIVLAALGRRRP